MKHFIPKLLFKLSFRRFLIYESTVIMHVFISSIYRFLTHLEFFYIIDENKIMIKRKTISQIRKDKMQCKLTYWFPIRFYWSCSCIDIKCLKRADLASKLMYHYSIAKSEMTTFFYHRYLVYVHSDMSCVLCQRMYFRFREDQL